MFSQSFSHFIFSGKKYEAQKHVWAEKKGKKIILRSLASSDLRPWLVAHLTFQSLGALTLVRRCFRKKVVRRIISRWRLPKISLQK
jgi:hypothetical protein